MPIRRRAQIAGASIRDVEALTEVEEVARHGQASDCAGGDKRILAGGSDIGCLCEQEGGPVTKLLIRRQHQPVADTQNDVTAPSTQTSRSIASPSPPEDQEVTEYPDLDGYRCA
jgi:hypothetical protein